MTKKKFVSLSQESLDKIYAWSEVDENYYTPLAEAYRGDCYVVGITDCSKIIDQLKPTWKGKRNEYGYISEGLRAGDYMYEHRDTVGRIILDMIKRQK